MTAAAEADADDSIKRKRIRVSIKKFFPLFVFRFEQDNLVFVDEKQKTQIAKFNCLFCFNSLHLHFCAFRFSTMCSAFCKIIGNTLTLTLTYVIHWLDQVLWISLSMGLFALFRNEALFLVLIYNWPSLQWGSTTLIFGFSGRRFRGLQKVAIRFFVASFHSQADAFLNVLVFCFLLTPLFGVREDRDELIR